MEVANIAYKMVIILSQAQFGNMFFFSLLIERKTNKHEADVAAYWLTKYLYSYTTKCGDDDLNSYLIHVHLLYSLTQVLKSESRMMGYIYFLIFYVMYELTQDIICAFFTYRVFLNMKRRENAHCINRFMWQEFLQGFVVHSNVI